jgi:hypothetical protein
LLGIQWQWGDAQCGTFGHMVTVSFQHGSLSISFLRVGQRFFSAFAPDNYFPGASSKP